MSGYTRIAGLLLVGYGILLGAVVEAGNAPELISKRDGSLPTGDSVISGGSVNGRRVRQVSEDGRFMVFTSSSEDIRADVLAGSANQQIYLWDRQTNTVRLVSINMTGTGGGNNSSSDPTISADGNYVAFRSSSTNLTTNIDTNGTADVFLFNRTAATNPKVTLASHVAGGSNAGSSFSLVPVINADGRYVAYTSLSNNLVAGDTNGQPDIFRYDRTTNTNVLVSHINGNPVGFPNSSSSDPSISDDGNWVSFSSVASNLVATDVNVALRDIFLFDGGSTTTTVVSHATGSANTSSGTSSAPVISGSGSHIAFVSSGSNLTAGDVNGLSDVFVYERATGTNTLASHIPASTNGGNLASSSPIISANGQYVAYISGAGNIVASKTNNFQGIFLYDVATGVNAHCSHPFNGPGNPQNTCVMGNISRDGRLLAYYSVATTLVASDTNGNWDQFLYDRVGDVNYLLTSNSAGTNSANSYSGYVPAIAGNGSVVLFQSIASNLVAGLSDLNNTTDVFAFTVVSGAKTLLTVRQPSQSGSGSSLFSTDYQFQRKQAMSADGRYVVFTSSAPDLVPNDTNGTQDVFLKDMQTGTIWLCSINAAGTGSSDNYSSYPAVSADGRYVVYHSYSSNITNDTIYQSGDLFLFDRDAAANPRNVMVSINGAGTGSGDGYIEEYYPSSISADGRYVAFCSASSDMGYADGNFDYDVFVFDRLAVANPKCALASVNSGATGTGNAISGAYMGPTVISADGRYVYYGSYASDLTGDPVSFVGDLFQYDRIAGTNKLISFESTRTSGANNISVAVDASQDGRYLLFYSYASDLGPVDGNGNADLFIADTIADTIELVSINSAGTGSGSVGTFNGTITPDGRYVVQTSSANNLVAGDTNNVSDIFVYDRLNLANPRNQRCSLDSAGAQGNGNCNECVITPDGRFVIFTSDASNLVANDTNGRGDVFMYDRAATVTATTLVLSGPATGGVGSSTSSGLVLSADGAYIGFNSNASNLSPDDTSGNSDTYRVRRRLAPLITWPNPAAIQIDTALSATQLNATVNFPGTLAYTPAAGTVLNLGLQRPLQVAYTSPDVTVCDNGSKTVYIDVTGSLSFVSAPVAQPSLVAVGAPVQFSAGVNLNNVTFVWNFGDGSPTATGASVIHSYAAAGAYAVTVTATHPFSGLNSAAQVPVQVFVLNTPPGGGGGTPAVNPDTDGDGFNDDIEAALGSNANNASDTPFGLPKSDESETLAAPKVQVKLNFQKSNADIISLSGTLPVVPGFNAAGKRVVISLSGVVRSFLLDARGNGAAADASFKLNTKKRVIGGSPFALKMKAGSYAQKLSSAGFVNAESRNALCTLKASIVIDGKTCNRDLEMLWNAKAGRGGKATYALR